MIEADRYTLVSKDETMSICIDKDRIKFTIVDAKSSTTIYFNIRELDFIMDIVPGLMPHIR